MKRSKEEKVMKRPTDDYDRQGDTSLQDVDWKIWKTKLRDVFKLLKQGGYIGPLGTSALKIAFAQLTREDGGVIEFHTKWTKDESWEYFANQVGRDLADGMRKQDDSGLPPASVDYYLMLLHAEWDRFPKDANFFYVFMAFLARYVILGSKNITMTRNDVSIIINSLRDGNVTKYTTVRDFVPVETMTDTRSFITYPDGQAKGASFVKFVYYLLQEGWRFDPDFVLDRVPENVQSELCCANCLSKDAQVQCGHDCGAAFYCGQECANAHYDVHELECIERRAGGRKNKGKGKVHKVMKEFKEHKLHSGSKHGPIVTNRKQAIAIALAEARRRGE